MWGNNVFGQLGSGKLIVNHIQIKHILVPIENPTFKKLELKVIDLAVGSFHCIALAQDKGGNKALFSWGMNLGNECGQSKREIIWEPKIIDYFKDHEVEIVSAGESGSVIKTNKGLYVFGKSTFLSKDVDHIDKPKQAGIRELQFDWWHKITDITLSENAGAFLIEY